MSEDFENEVRELQESIEEDIEESSKLEGISETCSLCRHPGRDLLTEVYYDNGKSIEAARTWFVSKFKRTYKDSTWERHFREHVDPFVYGHELVKKKKLDDLMERTAESKKEGKVSPVSMIKQMLFDFMLDSYMAKPSDMSTKQEKVDFSSMARNIASLAKVYKEYQQMEMDILSYGKSEDEQKKIMKNYMKTMINDVIKLFDGDPNAQDKIADAFGITNVGGEMEEAEFEVET